MELVVLVAVVLAAQVVGVVAAMALKVLANSLATIEHMHESTQAMLQATLDQRANDLSRAHGSLGMALADVTSRTAAAIGEAVQRATTPVQAPGRDLRDEAFAAARDLVSAGYQPEREDAADDDTDPTDAFISPDRGDAAFIGAGDRSPTGVPGLAFPDLDMALNGNGH